MTVKDKTNKVILKSIKDELLLPVQQLITTLIILYDKITREFTKEYKQDQIVKELQKTSQGIL